ncbi:MULTISPECIES: DUF2267 domain-containing protein [unclassified Mesorhizobium]|uniref:DUF2267 domain-containing protein n=1 Tax=unclassified Mesorhizobium TaxID=325217 RepID=UPI0019288CE9|nr:MULTISPECIES: DUF2267 domain-containing protein [unclassified Mesorhizobium]BCG97409.1 hypothetical protein MesoLj131a_62730 [Mesorhizobium sp. 131-2-1]BCH04480.1 hypothetical protein MesoLj131b_64790 [Mesorhizobium sp. 131-2-5]
MCARHDFNNALEVTQNWISDLMWRLGWDDRERVYQALIATLHALRDCLDCEHAVYMGARLPALLRGFYYEGWNPDGRAKVRNRNSFLERIHSGVQRDPAVDPEVVARLVLGQFIDRLTTAEVERAKAATPRMLHNLWPGSGLPTVSAGCAGSRSSAMARSPRAVSSTKA